jgi:hypothetical protein
MCWIRLQVVFWGNPTTPGHIDSVDYFMSGDVMEIDLGQTHYTEQLIRLSGQAIWCVPSCRVLPSIHHTLLPSTTRCYRPPQVALLCMASLRGIASWQVRPH